MEADGLGGNSDTSPSGLGGLGDFVPSCEWIDTEALVIKGVSIPDEPTF